jgi:hypothetical protein
MSGTKDNPIIARRKLDKDLNPEESYAEAVERVQRDNPGKIVISEEEAERKDKDESDSVKEVIDDKSLDGANPDLVPELDPMKVDPVPKPNIDTTVSVALSPIQTALKVIETELPTIKSFSSSLMYGQTQRMGRVYFMIEPSNRIGSFYDIPSFSEAVVQWVSNEWKRFDGMLMDMGDVLSDYTGTYGKGRHTPPTSVGFNVFQMVSSGGLQDSQLVRYVSQKLMHATDGKSGVGEDGIYKTKYAILRPYEKEMHERVHNYYFRRLGDAKEAFNFYRLFDDSRHRIVPPPQFGKDMRYVRAIKPVQNKQIFREVISNNSHLRQVTGNIAIMVSEQFVSAGHLSEQVVFQTLLQDLQVNTQRIMEVNTLPSTLSAVRGEAALRRVISALIDPESVVLHVSPRFDDGKIVTFIHMLLYKLLPSTVFDPETIMDIDNYLCKWIVDLFNVDLDFDQEQARRRTTNFLTQNFRNNKFGRYTTRLKPYLYTDPARPGSGWGTTESFGAAIRTHLNTSVDYTLQNGPIFSPFASVYNERQDAIQSGRQFSNLKMVYNALRELPRPGEKARAAVAVLKAITRQERRFSDMVHRVQTICLDVGRMGLFEAKTPPDMVGINRDDAVEVSLDGTDIMSMIMLIDYESVQSVITNVTKLAKYGF